MPTKKPELTTFDFGNKKKNIVKPKKHILKDETLTQVIGLSKSAAPTLLLEKKVSTAMALDPHVLAAAKSVKPASTSLSAYIQSAILEKLGFTIEEIYAHFSK